jgi:hypothetical protein
MAPQQSSSDFHSLYGPSDVERFTVRPGITMTVEYGPDQVACQMTIARKQPLLIQPPPYAPLLRESDANQVLDELAPPNIRGAKIRDTGGWQSGHAFSSGEDYENVEISRVTIDCKKSPEACVSSSAIKFKRKECDAINKESGEIGPALTIVKPQK